MMKQINEIPPMVLSWFQLRILTDSPNHFISNTQDSESVWLNMESVLE